MLIAIDKGNAREVESHLSEVDINFGQSDPLREAVEAGHKNIVVLLLSKGANPNYHTDWGVEGSPLTMATDSDKKDLAQILLDAGAEPSEKDKEKMEAWGCFDF